MFCLQYINPMELNMSNKTQVRANFWSRRKCVLPPKKRWSFSIRLMMHLPMMRRRTSPLPIGRTPELLFKEIFLHTVYASRNFLDSFLVAKRIAILATAFAVFAESSLKQLKFRFQPFAPKLNGQRLPCVFKAVVLTADAPMISEIAGWYGFHSNVFPSIM